MSAPYAKRFEAVFLCTHSKGPKMSYKAAAKYMHKSEDFVRKWVIRYKEQNNVDDLPERGKTRGTSKKEDKVIFKLFQRKSLLTLRQGQKLLAKKGVNISIMTLKRRLNEANISWHSTMLKPFLKPVHIENRRLWAMQNLNRDWSNVIFTDEASFCTWVPTKHAWSLPGKSPLQRTVKHPVKVHVWGCFSFHGFGTLYLFTHNLNAEKMLKIYRRALLKSAKKWFESDNESWILQEDNDPKHRSRLCTVWKAENDIETLDWPAQSPDANPIENVWSIIKRKLQGKRVYTLKQLCYHIRAIWRSLPQQYAENLVESMPKRCQRILDNNGDWTTY